MVNFGSGKLRSTSGNFGAPLGLSPEQTTALLNATRNLDAGIDGLRRRFHEADAGNEGPLTPEASEIATQIAHLERQAKIGAQIRSAVVDGDRERVAALLHQAGLPSTLLP